MSKLESILLLTMAGAYGVMSIITFAAYGIDKRRAARGNWRISEKTLHTLEVCCGWPGALVGQSVFRHKRRKGRFMLVFVGIVALHVILWIGIVWLRR